MSDRAKGTCCPSGGYQGIHAPWCKVEPERHALSEQDLPPLPEPAWIGDNTLDGYLDPDAEYTANQMRLYAAEAVRLELSRMLDALVRDDREGSGRNWSEYLRRAQFIQ